MTSRLLFVHGGRQRAREQFARGRGDWSQGLPVVLEKYGHLSFDVIAAEELDAVRDVERYACILVAALPESSSSRIDEIALERDAPPCFLESPSPRVQQALGVTRSEDAGTDGIVQTRSRELRRRAAQYGLSPSGRVQLPATRSVSYDHSLHWSALPDVGVSAEQASAWGAPCWHFRHWQVDRASEVLADWRSEATAPASPAVVRSGRVVGSAFELFAYLGQAHSSEPWPHGEFRNAPRTSGVEALLLAVIDELYALSAQPRVRLLPWPAGYRWALNVRHDFDRPLGPREVERVVDGHVQAGTAATWYWRARHLDPPRSGIARLFPGRARRRAEASLSAVRSTARHEIAHHTDRPWTGADREQRIIEAASGSRVAGTSAHGDPECFRFQGAPNVLWAHRQGLDYTELLERAHLHPHRFVTMASDGGIRELDIICLPHHESFDLSMRSGHTGRSRILRIVELFASAGGLLQVMNHPDLNVDALFETLALLPTAGRWDCTAREAVTWWRASHARSSLDLGAAEGGVVAMRSIDGLAGARLEVSHPDGPMQTIGVDVAPGGSTLVDLSGDGVGTER